MIYFYMPYIVILMDMTKIIGLLAFRVLNVHLILYVIYFLSTSLGTQHRPFSSFLQENKTRLEVDLGLVLTLFVSIMGRSIYQPVRLLIPKKMGNLKPVFHANV